MIFFLCRLHERKITYDLLTKDTRVFYRFQKLILYPFFTIWPGFLHDQVRFSHPFVHSLANHHIELFAILSSFLATTPTSSSALEHVSNTPNSINSSFSTFHYLFVAYYCVYLRKDRSAANLSFYLGLLLGILDTRNSY